jgi:hypothetical protein
VYIGGSFGSGLDLTRSRLSFLTEKDKERLLEEQGIDSRSVSEVSEKGTPTRRRLEYEQVPDPNVPTDPQDKAWGQLSGKEKMSRVLQALSNGLAAYASPNPGQTAAQLIVNMQSAKEARKTQRLKAAEDAKIRNRDVDRVNMELEMREEDIARGERHRTEDRTDRKIEREEDRQFARESQQADRRFTLFLEGTRRDHDKEMLGLRTDSERQLASMRLANENAQIIANNLINTGVRADEAIRLGKAVVSGAASETDIVTLNKLAEVKAAENDFGRLAAWLNLADTPLGLASDGMGGVTRVPLGVEGVMQLMEPALREKFSQALSATNGGPKDAGAFGDILAEETAKQARVQGAVSQADLLLTTGWSPEQLLAELDKDRSLYTDAEYTSIRQHIEARQQAILEEEKKKAAIAQYLFTAGAMGTRR